MRAGRKRTLRGKQSSVRIINELGCKVENSSFFHVSNERPEEPSSLGYPTTDSSPTESRPSRPLRFYLSQSLGTLEVLGVREHNHDAL
jgi:hypothetical protein